MSREIRRVPPDWHHPKDENDSYYPLYDKTYARAVFNHIAHSLSWYIKHPRYLREWLETWPDRRYHRPRWAKGEATHYQIYEDVTEGTPVSPVFADLDEMKVWLLEEGYSEKAATMFVADGWAPSMVFAPGKGVSGIGIHSLDWL